MKQGKKNIKFGNTVRSFLKEGAFYLKNQFKYSRHFIFIKIRLIQLVIFGSNNLIYFPYAAYKHLISESYPFHKGLLRFLYLRNISEGILTAYPHINRYRKSYSRIPEYSGFRVKWKKILRFTGKSPPIGEGLARRHDGIRELTDL